MKKIKQLVCILLAVLLCIPAAAPVSAASAKYTRAEKAYKKWISKNQVVHYDIVDIDGNGIPELLAANYGESRVYTYHNGKKKMVLLKKIDSGRAGMSGASAITYNCKKKTFTLLTGSTADATKYVYSVKNRKASKELTLTYDYGRYTASRKPTYYKNGKKVSRSTYKKALKTTTKKYREMRYTK